MLSQVMKRLAQAWKWIVVLSIAYLIFTYRKTGSEELTQQDQLDLLQEPVIRPTTGELKF
jgi:hypothetical protein